MIEMTGGRGDRTSQIAGRVGLVGMGLGLALAPSVALADALNPSSSSVPLGGTAEFSFTFPASAIGGEAVLLRASTLGPVHDDGIAVPLGGRMREVMTFPITAENMTTLLQVPGNPALNGKGFCLACVVRRDGVTESASNAVAAHIANSQLGLQVVPGSQVMGFDGRDSASDSTLHAASFVSSRVGYVVGTGGTLLKTGDGGASFTPIDVTSGAPINLKDVDFLDANHGFVMGHSFSGIVYRTSDGGQFWSSSVVPGKINAGDFVDGLTGYVCGLPQAIGNGGPISRTLDGGITWTSQADGIQAELMDIRMVSDSTGYAVGRFGTILKTTNMGNTWVSLAVPPAFQDTWFMGVEALGDGSTAYFVGEGGVILATSDGGATFHRLRSGTEQTLRSIQFADAQVGFLTGDRGTLLQTFDAGRTWVPYDSFYEGHPNTNLVLGVAIVTRDEAYVVGYGGMVGAFGPVPSDR